MIDDDIVITIQDVRDAGYCVSGAKEWFRSRGLDFRSFLREGIPYRQIAHFDDAMLTHILGRKRGGE